MKAFCSVLLGVFLWGTPLLAQFEVGLVLPFENNARDPNLDWVGESFVEVLSANLDSSRLMMLGRRERSAAFEALGIPYSSILSNATIYKLAETLDVDTVILGRYDSSDGELKAVAQVLDMEGPSLSEPFTESGPLANILNLQAGLSWQIHRFLRPDLLLSKEEYIQEHKGPRLDAFENYLRGLVARDRTQKIRYYRTALRLDPLFIKPAFGLGIIYFNDRDYATSVLWLSKLRREDLDYLEANYFLGLAYLHLAEYERSASAFRLVANHLPLNEVYNNLGIALTRLDRPGALQYFEKVVQADPSDSEFQFNLGYAYWKRESYEQAIPHLRKALEGVTDPAWGTLYMECLQKAGHSGEAARQRQLLQQEFPDWNTQASREPLQNLERIKDAYDAPSFRQLRILSQLQIELKHSKLSQAEHFQVHFQQAQQLLQEGFDREAVEELQQAMDYAPEDARPYRELAKIHAKSGRLEDAIQSLHQVLRRERVAEDYLMLARIYLDQGKLEEAGQQLNAALNLEPSNPTAQALKEE